MKTAICLLAFAVTLHAEFVQIPVNITFKATQQGHIQSMFGHTTAQPPSNHAITTKTSLSALASDLFFDYGIVLPSNARLVFFYQTTNFSESYFGVTDGSGVLIADLEDYIDFDRPGTNYIWRGDINQLQGTAKNLIVTVPFWISADDTESSAPGNHLRYRLTGLLTVSENDSTPNNGVYTKRVTLAFVGQGVGIVNGIIEDTSLIVSGKMKGTGTRQMTINP